MQGKRCSCGASLDRAGWQGDDKQGARSRGAHADSLDLLACGFPEGITGGPIVLYDGRFLRLGFDRVSTFNRVAPFDVASFGSLSLTGSPPSMGLFL